MANQKSDYRTTSLDLTTFLAASNIVLFGIEPVADNPRRFLFVLEDNARRKSLTDKFLIGQGGDVNVHRFLECQRQLKRLLHAER